MKPARFTLLLIAFTAVGFGYIIWSAVKHGDQVGRAHYEKPELTVMTYPSFSSAVGPGPKLFRIPMVVFAIRESRRLR